MNLYRSLLYVPGNSPGMVQNIPIFDSDVVMIDLEDAISIAEKDAARLLTRNFLSFYKRRNKDVYVRINGLDTQYFVEDLKEILPALPDGIRLPKADNGDVVEQLDLLLTEAEQRLKIANGYFKIIPSIESALGVLNCVNTVCASKRIVALAFGAEDYTASMGINRTKTGEELLFARTHIAMVAKAYGIQAIDSVFSDVNDMEALRDEVLLIKKLGFTGKSLVNPRQINVIHSAFRPTVEELEYAIEVMEAMKQAKLVGSGVISLKGKMIDAPVLNRAVRTIREGKVCGMTEYDLFDEVYYGQK